ncbi:MAG: cell division protein [Brevundimonas sp.]|uniref:ABC transporter permease n=1 Tax=Brevundimonas albigilva TaxID=1312364 RepID=A0ABY4SI49_9CAUL|nr:MULTISPECIES: ABC transporter permease [Brevundimonas]PZU55520.1 MAG: cell division protein [Brevundimonas sp.]URI14682.1 ABC transporter permease [Brevundimonas albigilva]
MIRLVPARRPGLLPPAAAGEPWLMTVIAVLCFLACLAAVAGAAADRAAQGWARQLGAEATVQVRPRVGESGATAAARAAETLAGVDGVEEAAALDRKAAEDLLRPWLGDAVLPDLPLPFLVAVRLNPEAPASALTLSRALAEAGLDASVDDHSLWRGEVERSARLIALLAAAAFLAIALAAGAAIAYATRAGLAAGRSTIETLSLNGATDARIAGLFMRRFGLMALAAGAIGAAGAGLLVIFLRFLGGSEGLTQALPLAWSDLLLLSPCPLLAATVAVLAARFAALKVLGSDRQDG